MNNLVKDSEIKNLIYEIRGQQVMLDSDLARLYEVETKYLNRQMKRNIERFPEDFCFRLTKDELSLLNLKCQKVTTSLDYNNHGGRRTLPYVYTETGVSMLA